MNRAGTPLKIVILDACRDNPLPRRTRSAARGLAIQTTPSDIKGTAIVFSAAPGQVAQDGPKGGNGVFTGELLKALDQPGLNLEDVFKVTAAKVAVATNGKQDPWINSSMKGYFYFRPVGQQIASRTTPVSRATTVDKEALFWDTIKDSNRKSDFEAYLKQFPNGTFAGLARGRLGASDQQTGTRISQPAAQVAKRVVPDKPALASVGSLDGRWEMTFDYIVASNADCLETNIEKFVMAKGKFTGGVIHPQDFVDFEGKVQSDGAIKLSIRGTFTSGTGKGVFTDAGGAGSFYFSIDEIGGGCEGTWRATRLPS